MENSSQLNELLQLYSSNENVFISGKLNIGLFMTSILVALVISSFVALLYRFKHQGVFFQPSFQLSIICAALITTIVIYTIGGNLILSLGLVGALSIVRFRTAVKDSQDIIYIYWAIAIGMSAATQNFMIIFIGTFVIALAIYAFGKFQARSDSGLHLLTVTSTDMSVNSIESILKDQTHNFKNKYEILNENGYELAYEIKIDDSKSLLEQFRAHGLCASCYPCENKFGGVE
jgi:hypothetical protein